MVAAEGSNRIQAWRQAGERRRTGRNGDWMEFLELQEKGRRLDQEHEEEKIARAFF